MGVISRRSKPYHPTSIGQGLSRVWPKENKTKVGRWCFHWGKKLEKFTPTSGGTNGKGISLGTTIFYRCASGNQWLYEVPLHWRWGRRQWWWPLVSIYNWCGRGSRVETATYPSVGIWIHPLGHTVERALVLKLLRREISLKMLEQIVQDL